MNPENPTGSESAAPAPRAEAQRVPRPWPRWFGAPQLLALALVAGTVALFWPAVHHPFMPIDDADYITTHPLVPQGLTWMGIGLAFTARHSGNWHPLTTLSHMLDCQLFGVNPAGHHFVNILLHSFNAALVFLLLYRLTGARWRSAIVAALFAAHPLRVESVAWVSERKDVLSVFFFLLTVWAYSRYAQGRGLQAVGRDAPAHLRGDAPAPEGCDRSTIASSKRWFSLALLFSALGLMSKPMLVTLPFVLLLLDYWPLGRFRISDFKFPIFGLSLNDAPSPLPSPPAGERVAAGWVRGRFWGALHGCVRGNLVRLWPLVREKIPFLALSFLVAFITTQVQETAMADPRALPFWPRILNMFVSYGRYVGQTFWPVDLAVVYPYDLNPPVAQVAAGLALVLAVSILAWLWRERDPWFAVGWAWFLGTLVPVIGLVQVGIQAHADRYTYLPSIGLLVLLVWSAALLVNRYAMQTRGAVARVRLLLAGLVALVLLALALQTRAQLALWRDNETLMRHTLRVAGSSELVRGSLGALYLETGRLKEAEEQYRLGLQLDGDAWPAVVGLAHVYAAQGKTNEAERLFRRALAKRAAPAYYVALADFLQDQNRLDEARVHYLQALARAPYHAGARTQLGNLYAKQQNWPAAREQYERALKLNPKLAGVWYNLGRLEMLQGNSDAAMKHFARAVELQPGFAPAYNSLGFLLALRGQLDAAIFHYQQALASDPNFVEAHVNLAEALARRGRFDPARTHFEVALKLQTNSARAHLGLAGVYAAQRQTADAIRHLREAIPLDPENPEPLNNLAWLLATHPDAAVRDGAEAVRLATRAVELSKTNDVEMLDTLAAAYAEDGQFTQAVAVAGQALELARGAGQTNVAAGISQRLELYRRQTAFRVTMKQ